MERAKFVVIIVGVVLFIFGFLEWQLKTVAKETPLTISAAELASLDPGRLPNAHVILTNFSLCNDFVYKAKSRRGNSHWEKVWVPAVPQGQEYNRGNVRIIVTDKHCQSEGDVAALDRGQLQGVIINKIS